LVRDDNHLICCLGECFYSDQIACLFVHDSRSNTNTATSMSSKLRNLRSLTIAFFTNDKDTCVVLNNIHTNNLIAGAQANTTDTTSSSAHRTHISFVETNCLTLACADHNFVIASGSTNPLQLVPF